MITQPIRVVVAWDGHVWQDVNAIVQIEDRHEPRAQAHVERPRRRVALRQLHVPPRPVVDWRAVRPRQAQVREEVSGVRHPALPSSAVRPCGRSAEQPPLSPRYERARRAGLGGAARRGFGRVLVQSLIRQAKVPSSAAARFASHAGTAHLSCGSLV